MGLPKGQSIKTGYGSLLFQGNLRFQEDARNQRAKRASDTLVRDNSVNITASVIVSTYNQPEWLKKVLWGFEQQIEKDFEIIIADDGSTEETTKVIQEFQEYSDLKIIHVWQEDHGFQKTKILNKAIKASKGEYLIFTDGDCIPRNDFVTIHLNKRRPGYFVSAGYFKLPMDLSKAITMEDIVTQRCFNPKWLLENGLPWTFKLNKLSKNKLKSAILNRITTTRRSWNGNNASGWRKDILAVNGFDERMQYGGEDRELGERMRNNGIKPIQMRYSVASLHLDHARGYITEDMVAINNAIRKLTKKEKRVWTKFGLKQSEG